MRVYKGKDPEIDSYSAFWDNEKLSQTDLFTMLIDRDVTDVFMCGLATDICVGLTVLHSHEHGFNSFLIDDASRGVCEEDIKCMRKQLTDIGVKIITSDQVIHEGVFGQILIFRNTQRMTKAGGRNELICFNSTQNECAGQFYKVIHCKVTRQLKKEARMCIKRR